MFRLISLSGFLHDSINFNLAKLFNDIQCNSILISSKTDHFEILPLTNHSTGDDINLYRSKFRCPTLGAPLLKKVPQVPQVPQSGAPLLKDLESLNSPIFNDFPSFHRPITLLVTTSTVQIEGFLSINQILGA